ncbi:hypothetical protein ACFYUV_20875 [Nonomuraea sp. NPDC003560]
MNKIPPTLKDWQRQIEFFEWMKRETPGVYQAVVTVIEQRPEQAR